MAVAKPADPSRAKPDPKTSIPTCAKRPHRGNREMLSGAGLPRDEAQTIISIQACVGPEPQIPVRCLSNYSHGPRNAFPCSPRCVRKLADQYLRFRSISSTGEHHPNHKESVKNLRNDSGQHFPSFHASEFFIWGQGACLL